MKAVLCVTVNCGLYSHNFRGKLCKFNLRHFMENRIQNTNVLTVQTVLILYDPPRISTYKMGM
jgi:hypothetical protein